MPTRIVRQGINDSEAINSLSWRGELLYRRLMLEVDDFGRYENDPRLIRAKIFSRQLERWTDQDVFQAVKECSETVVNSADGDYFLLELYRIGGKAYLQINNFGQRIRPGQKSKYPDPPEISAKRGKNPRVPVKIRGAREIPAYSESEPKAESKENPSAAIAAACETAALAFDLSDSEREEAYSTMVMPGLPQAARDRAAERIHDRHPAVRRCSLRVVKQKLEAIARNIPVAKRLDAILAIDSNHEAWCDTEQWRKDGGEFAKGLENWLSPTKGRWEDPPARASPIPSERPGHMNPGLID